MLSRDIAAITMDMNGVETIKFNALGGTDTITVNDLSKTAVKHVAIDLSATPGSGKGDGNAPVGPLPATDSRQHLLAIHVRGAHHACGAA